MKPQPASNVLSRNTLEKEKERREREREREKKRESEKVREKGKREREREREKRKPSFSSFRNIEQFLCSGPPKEYHFIRNIYCFIISEKNRYFKQFSI